MRSLVAFFLAQSQMSGLEGLKIPRMGDPENGGGSISSLTGIRQAMWHFSRQSRR
jgi:hypothetical protein